MAHEVETMAYANEVPWHGLGEHVDGNMSPQEMLVAARLDWTVSKRPAYTPSAPLTINPYQPQELMYVPEHHYIVRDSDNSILSHAGEGYIPFQNEEVMRFFKKFTEAGQMTMETAGSLKKGREIWGLAKISSKFELAGGDEVKGYLLLNNSHQVGKAMTVMFTPVRVVCNNTLTQALNMEGNRFRVPHITMFDEEVVRAAEEALGISSAQMEKFKEQAEFLSKKQAKAFDVDKWIAELLQPQSLIERAKSNNPESLPPLHEEFKRTATSVRDAVSLSPGAELASSRGTWWGALNGLTYVVDHQTRSKESGNSLHSAWFGSGANLKRRALEKALEYADAA